MLTTQERSYPIFTCLLAVMTTLLAFRMFIVQMEGRTTLFEQPICTWFSASPVAFGRESFASWSGPRRVSPSPRKVRYDPAIDTSTFDTISHLIARSTSQSNEGCGVSSWNHSVCELLEMSFRSMGMYAAVLAFLVGEKRVATLDGHFVGSFVADYSMRHGLRLQEVLRTMDNTLPDFADWSANEMQKTESSIITEATPGWKLIRGAVIHGLIWHSMAVFTSTVTRPSLLQFAEEMCSCMQSPAPGIYFAKYCSHAIGHGFLLYATIRHSPYFRQQYTACTHFCHRSALILPSDVSRGEARCASLASVNFGYNCAQGVFHLYYVEADWKSSSMTWASICTAAFFAAPCFRELFNRQAAFEMWKDVNPNASIQQWFDAHKCLSALKWSEKTRKGCIFGLSAHLFMLYDALCLNVAVRDIAVGHPHSCDVGFASGLVIARRQEFESANWTRFRSPTLLTWCERFVEGDLRGQQAGNRWLACIAGAVYGIAWQAAVTRDVAIDHMTTYWYCKTQMDALHESWVGDKLRNQSLSTCMDTIQLCYQSMTFAEFKRSKILYDDILLDS